MFHRMGELLVEYGELSREALESILREQARWYRAFGRIAAERFGVSEEAIRRAWAEQYARYCPRVDLRHERLDPAVQTALAPEDCLRQRLLPLRRQDGDLVLVTDRASLAAALQFVDEQIDEPTMIWLAAPRDLDRRLKARDAA